MENRSNTTEKDVLYDPRWDPRNHVPPVIIDGGSLDVASIARFRRSNTGVQPRPYLYTQENPVYATLKGVRIIDDFGTLLYESREVGAGEIAQIRLWLQKVEDEEDDNVTYEQPDPPYGLNIEPQILITGGQLEMRASFIIKNPKKKHKGTHHNHWKYGLDEFDSEPFRIAQVSVTIGGSTYVTDARYVEAGFRTIIGFRHV